jgi:hypothetical protein
MDSDTKQQKHVHIDRDAHMDGQQMSVGEYLRTRIPTLKPPLDRPPNPFKVIRSLSFMNWMMFLCALLGWTWDAFDFFTVSLTGEPLTLYRHVVIIADVSPISLQTFTDHGLFLI